MVPPGKGKREGREREGWGRWDWDPSTPDGKGGKGMEGRMGWEGRKGEGRGGEGEEISIHGLKLVAPPLHELYVYDTTDLAVIFQDVYLTFQTS